MNDEQNNANPSNSHQDTEPSVGSEPINPTGKSKSNPQKVKLIIASVFAILGIIGLVSLLFVSPKDPIGSEYSGTTEIINHSKIICGVVDGEETCGTGYTYEVDGRTYERLYREDELLFSEDTVRYKPDDPSDAKIVTNSPQNQANNFFAGNMARIIRVFSFAMLGIAVAVTVNAFIGDEINEFREKANSFLDEYGDKEITFRKKKKN